jgi:hypothetical protein
MPADAATPKRYGLRLVLAWSLVGIPLVAGVLMTVENALKLFQ